MGIENCDKLLNEPGKGDPNWAQACKPYAPPCPLCDSKDAALARKDAALKMAVEALEHVEKQFPAEKIMMTIDHNCDWMEIETGEIVCSACGGTGDDRPLEHEDFCFIPKLSAALAACREELKGGV